MNGLPYYKAYPRDFIEGTIGLDFETKAAYRLVIDLIYMQGGALPDDARYISGLLGCSVKKWNVLRDRLISAGKVEVRGDYLGNLRADKELETLGKFQDKQRENRARPNKNKGLESPSSDHTEPDTDTVKKEEAKASSKKRGSRLSAEWRLPRPWGEWAVAEGLSEQAVRIEADKFRDYWISASGSNAVKLDWQATWRNWVRKAVTDRQKPAFRSISGGKDWRVGDLRALSPTRVQEFWPDGKWDDRSDLTEADVANHPRFIGRAPAYAG
ncbi:DUF1376 domain-containing protein [Paracoccus homiensis]|uniref:Uncharacterized conserved protein YdaU, DUF1376 family n=1 Tax=Paracoccus homiensis TaxID=364199 RepID=A0A1I0J034_9RHOB|nr:DUF1376 domain-containing protein [Paracoccus homiensis]SEU02810.1 Uncharacterized conserved protein YdaU, DUF1376 family [Paracoccus homiensis]